MTQGQQVGEGPFIERVEQGCAAASNTGRSAVTRTPVPLSTALGRCGDGKAGSTSCALSNTQPARTAPASVMTS